VRFVGYQIFFGISKKNYITNKNFKNYKKKFLGKSIDIYKTKKNYEQNIKHFSIVLAWPFLAFDGRGKKYIFCKSIQTFKTNTKISRHLYALEQACQNGSTNRLWVEAFI